MIRTILIGAGIGCGLSIISKPIGSGTLVPLEYEYKKEKEQQFLAVQSFKLEAQWLSILPKESRVSVREFITTYFRYGEPIVSKKAFPQNVKMWHKIRLSIHPP